MIRLFPKNNQAKSIFNKNKFQYKDVLKLFKEISGYENFKSLDERFLESTRPTVISKEKK
jgi:hypothetical protein